jgi:hypothetical protein
LVGDDKHPGRTQRHAADTHPIDVEHPSIHSQRDAVVHVIKAAAGSAY